MKRRRHQVFVCSIAHNNELLTKVISAGTQEEAALAFKEQYNIDPKEILGPFLTRKPRFKFEKRSYQFTNKVNKAIYNEWIVNAFRLKEPENHAYLVFIKRIDDKKVSPPKGNILVPLSDLRFI